MHTSAQHGFLLRRCHTEALILLVCDLTVLCAIRRVPVTWIVTALAAFDTNQCAGAGQRGKAEFRQTFCILLTESLLLGLDAPILEIPEVRVKLLFADRNFVLLHALSEPITGLSGYIVFELRQFLAGQFTGDHTLSHAPELSVSCFCFEMERLHLCVNTVAPAAVVFHKSARRVQKL